MSIEIIAGKVGQEIGSFVAQSILAEATKRILKKDPFKCAIEQALDELRSEKPDDAMVIEEIYHDRKKIFDKIDISDETTFKKILAENDVKPETSSRLYKKLTKKFNNIIKETAQENSEVFKAYVIKEFEEIGTDNKEIVKVLKNLAQADKFYLDRIIEYFEKLEIKEKAILHLDSIESKLRKGEIFEEKPFRPDGPLWIDFEKEKENYIVRRLEVCKIIDMFEKGISYILLIGNAASGKSVIARNVGFELASKYDVFYFDSKDFETHTVDTILNDILNLKADSLVIIEDVHLYPKYCDDLMEDILRNGKIAIKVLFTARPTYNLHRQVDNLDKKCEKITLEAFDMVDDIINKYFEKKNKTPPSAREKETLISQSKKSLWVLAYFLMYWEKGKTIKINKVYEMVYNDLIRLDNKYGTTGSHYVILALAPFYSYEIKVKKPFITTKLKLNEMTIKKLLDVGEIKESNGFLSLYHSAIAEIYVKTGERYIDLTDSLLDVLRDFNENFYAKEDYMVNMYRYYLGGYKAENYAEVLTRLRYEERLINDILSDKNTFFAIYDLENKERDPQKLWDFIDTISSANGDFVMFLVDRLLNYLVLKLEKIDINIMGEFINHNSNNNKELAIELGRRLFESIVLKIEDERDYRKIMNFAEDIVATNQDLGIIFAHSLRKAADSRGGSLPLFQAFQYFKNELYGKRERDRFSCQFK